MTLSGLSIFYYYQKPGMIDHPFPEVAGGEMVIVTWPAAWKDQEAQFCTLYELYIESPISTSQVS